MRNRWANASRAPAAEAGNGVAYGFSAYFLWGFLPLYFHLLDDVGSVEIVVNRIVWSFLLLLPILALRGALGAFLRLVRTGTAMLTLTVTSALLAIHWLVSIWSVNTGPVVAASLGYFLNPLFYLLLGLHLTSFW